MLLPLHAVRHSSLLVLPVEIEFICTITFLRLNGLNVGYPSVPHVPSDGVRLVEREISFYLICYFLKYSRIQIFYVYSTFAHPVAIRHHLTALGRVLVSRVHCK